MTKLEELELKIAELNQLERKIRELSEQQVKILSDFWNEKSDLAQRIKDSHYMFSHPTIKYRTSRGPVLGHSREDNSLFVFSLGEGLREVNLFSNETSPFTWKKLIELGMFEDAYEGIKYLDRMIDEYINDDQKIIRDMEERINKI